MSKPSDPSHAAFLARMAKEDPDFGKVSNSEPGSEFAFELTRRWSVSEISTMSEDEASKTVESVDDLGNKVGAIPLDLTCWQVDVDVGDDTVPLGDDDSITPGQMLHRIAAEILQRGATPHQFNIHQDEVATLPSLVFYRFYYEKSQAAPWWSCTFDDLGE